MDMEAQVETWPVVAQDALAGGDQMSGLFAESALRV